MKPSEGKVRSTDELLDRTAALIPWIQQRAGQLDSEGGLPGRKNSLRCVTPADWPSQLPLTEDWRANEPLRRKSSPRC